MYSKLGGCPRCGGAVLNNYGERQCVICGYEPPNQRLKYAYGIPGACIQGVVQARVTTVHRPQTMHDFIGARV